MFNSSCHNFFIRVHRYIRIFLSEFLKESQADRFSFFTSASRTDIIYNACVSTHRITVYRMVHGTITDALLLHVSDHRFKCLQVLTCVTVQLDIADMSRIGLAETLKALTGKHHGESEASQKLGLEIIGHMRNRMDEESRKTGLNFTLLATPAEGLSGRFVRIDQKKYGKIPGVTDREYYTNSFHVPVYYPIKAYKKIQLEDNKIYHIIQ